MNTGTLALQPSVNLSGQQTTSLSCFRHYAHPPPAIPMNSQDDMTEMFDSVPGLTTLQRETVKARYRFLLQEYRWRSWQYAILFYLFRITMTVGSLAVPALLSLKVVGSSGEAALYWTTWAISLAVTTSNGMMTLFKLDKRFFMLHGVAERLRTETWQYLTLSGRYAGHYNSDEEPSHANQYVFYCTNIEKIRMRHMDDEYISAGEGGDNKLKQTQITTHTLQQMPLATAPPPLTVSQVAVPSVPPSANQVTLPPVGTTIPAFLSPTRNGGEIPTPPQNPMSRRSSFSEKRTNIASLKQSHVDESSTPPVGNATATFAIAEDTKEKESEHQRF